MLNKPILFIIFNRPLETRRVFETIRNAKPSELYIAADGPRPEIADEKVLCEEARNIVKNIDWPCKVTTRFQETNLGCRKNVSTSIDWFFEHVGEGIILEDDCLPDSSFFTFASEMLERYRTNETIMHISGVNFLSGIIHGNENPPPSYYFSHCPHIWGWATWKRAWESYDVDMKDLDSYIASKKIYSLFKDAKVADFWISLFIHIKKKNIDTWDAQWAFAVMKDSGLAVTPNMNLVQNIGFGNGSTHTSDTKDPKSQPSQTMTAIVHPHTIAADQEADDALVKTMYIEPFWKKLFRRLKVR